MVVGALVLHLRLPENQTLKGKRGVVRSLLARLQHRYHVAAAEVGANDRWQAAEIGVSCVSNSAAHANEILASIVQFVERERLEVEVLDYEIEILHAL
jgi:uncharacterized protein YlxP (DUF503 family)